MNHLLKKYYDGTTTLEEERQLRQWLSSAPPSPQADATRAVMAYAALVDDATTDNVTVPSPQPRRLSWRLTVSMSLAAACMAALVAVGAGTFTTPPMQGKRYEARLDGNRITDPQEVATLMAADLNAISAAQDDFDDDLAMNLMLVSDIHDPQP